TGDRSLDLLRRTSPAKLELVPLLTRGDAWRLYLDRPLWTYGIDRRASVGPVAGAPERSAFAAVGPDALVLFEVAP
ncbi:MAG: hypothetical protein AAFZ65_12130, partial [Planctomycetota bacterium]